MCGISGVIVKDKDARAITATMVQTMHHRGPDGNGVQLVHHAGTRIALGSNRLAILDLSSAASMPMHNAANGDWIAYNGEVYNFQEIRAELEALGVPFQSTGDTEVILKAYAQWGADCVARLRGMFGFALWDSRKQELLIARDRAGKKPIYYHHTASGDFAFASEIRALLDSGLVARKLNPNALDVYLFNGHLIAPETIIAGVYSLMPSHWMRVSAAGAILETQRYWSPPVETDGADWRRDRNAVLDAVRASLAEAVKLRMVSDVPLGAFLSGGLDSSVVVALMAKASADVRTFSVVFDEAGFDESQYSRWVAEKFKTRHSEVRITQADFVRMLPDALDAMDQPSYDGPNTYCVSRAAREDGMTVALSGLGGDEVFGGYHEFRVGLTYAKLRRAFGGAPFARQIANAIGARGGIEPNAALQAMELVQHGRSNLNGSEAGVAGGQLVAMKFNWAARARLISKELAYDRSWFGLPPAFLDFIQLPDDHAPELGQMSRLVSYTMMGERLMRDMDCMSMGASLEVRAPMTDHKFIETAWKIPSAERCAGAPEKPMEMELLKPILGPEYPYHRKQGFVFPFEKWVKNSALYGVIEGVVRDGALARRIGLDPDALAVFMKQEQGRSWYTMWTLFCLMRWCDRNGVSL